MDKIREFLGNLKQGFVAAWIMLAPTTRYGLVGFVAGTVFGALLVAAVR